MRVDYPLKESTLRRVLLDLNPAVFLCQWLVSSAVCYADVEHDGSGGSEVGSSTTCLEARIEEREESMSVAVRHMHGCLGRDRNE